MTGWKELRLNNKSYNYANPDILVSGRSLIAWALLAMLLFVSGPVAAVICTSAATGNWNVPVNWFGCAGQGSTEKESKA